MTPYLNLNVFECANILLCSVRLLPGAACRPAPPRPHSEGNWSKFLMSAAAGSQGAAEGPRQGPGRPRCKNWATHCPAEAMQINLVTNEEFVAALTGSTKGGQRRTNLLRAGVTFCRPGRGRRRWHPMQARPARTAMQLRPLTTGGERARRTILLQCTWEYATVREFFVTVGCHMKDAAWPLQVGGRCIVLGRDTFIRR